MKKLAFLVVMSIILFSCNTISKKEKESSTKETATQTKTYNFPERIARVLKKHGGVEAWNKAQTLSYRVKDEKHTIDLHSRKTLVNAEKYCLGYDGKDIWLSQTDATAFQKDPKFYYNLYFYFYAMPFVLADDGIIYEDIEPLVFEGVSYPGVKISYKADVGTSPDDNYFMYFNSETDQMEWLGYTVTYFSKKKSESVKMIRYDNWENVNGFVLPKSITWYKKDEESGTLSPTEKVLTFSEAMVSNEAKEAGFYTNQSK